MFRHQFSINPSISLMPLIDDTNIELFETIKNDLDHDRIQSLFIKSCWKGAFIIAKGLLKFDPNIDIHAENEIAFIKACSTRNLEMIQWLWQLDQNIDIHAQNDLAFKLACSVGHLETLQWLLQLDQNIDIHSEYEVAFQLTCFNGHLEVAKWLFQLGLSSNLLEAPNNFGSDKIAENQRIDIHAQNEFAFRLACSNGHLEIAK